MKKVPNSKDYYVDENGDVFRNGRKFRKNKVSSGYESVTITYEDGSRKIFYIHRLVAELYLPNPENKPVVNHKNLNKKDNRVLNLEWVTYKENSKHAHENGAFRVDDLHCRAKYELQDIKNVCQLLSEGYRICEVSKLTSVPKATVDQIHKRICWTHISKDYIFYPRKYNLSESTIKWVCEMINSGLSNVEISKLSTNLKITRQKVNQIRNGTIYRTISEKYLTK